MRKYRIRKTTYSDGLEVFKVEKQRKKFFLFGPPVWVNAGWVEGGGWYDTTCFMNLKEAQNFLRALSMPPKREVVEEVDVP